MLSGCIGAADATTTDPFDTPVGHAELRLVGEWTGTVDEEGSGVVGMVIGHAATDGTGFDGDLTFAISGGETTLPVHAAMTPHGHLVATIGADASVEVHIVDPQTLDYCFSRYGSDFVYACGRLVRAS